ncbi:MAG: TIGR03790 family protein [Proteobacteria bacterium]|nr:TIGR03790 family protein [Pseudomonadota bacterium]
MKSSTRTQRPQRPPRAWPWRALLLLLALAAARPAVAIDVSQLAVIINMNDPVSYAIGEYYVVRRHLPLSNIIKIRFEPGSTTMSEGEFKTLKAQVERQTASSVQAYALTWAAPYRVECMSITAAFAFGFNRAYCASGCKPTELSPMFNATSREPYTEFGMRPTMSIAARDFEDAVALIDRGVRADGSLPTGRAYLMSTSDKARNVRAMDYPAVKLVLGKRVAVSILRQDVLYGARDVLFYFTGRAKVAGLETLGFKPGAVADHLTSFGGMLTDSGQMSALRWLEAGATGSYGTVQEPCNFPQKFPDPVILVDGYLRGETLIEAYWKSVAMPGQGIFIGEPLAAPFRPNPADD